MNELKIKVIEYSGREFNDLYLYYLDKDNRIVATLAVNNRGSLVCDIHNNNYREIIVSIINKLTGNNYGIEEEYFYLDNNEVVWNNTRKYINDNNLEINKKSESDLELEELRKTK